MSGRNKTGRLAAAIVAVVFSVAILLGELWPREAQPPGQPARPRAGAQAVVMPANLVSIEISLETKDKEAAWAGVVQLSQGRVLDLAGIGGVPVKIDGLRFKAQPAGKKIKTGKDGSVVLRLDLDAPPTAALTVKTNQGQFMAQLRELETAATFLDGRASLKRQEGAVRLTGRDTDDDYPALARGTDGSAWLAYLEYVPGKPIVMERVKTGDFSSLVPEGNGDRLLLRRCDGQVWQPPLEVTEGGLRLWRPTVAVDGQGKVWIAWSQFIDEDWEIFCRCYTPPREGAAEGSWSEIVRLTRTPGADFHVVAATDSAGTVWLAWQAWRQGQFDIMLQALAPKHPWQEAKPISTSRANDWSPAIAADSRGHVYVAYDTYDQANYDVRLVKIHKEVQTITVAQSARFEARPSIVCDERDRVWIAFEEGDEQWGKDSSFPPQWLTSFKLTADRYQGYGLYSRRDVVVKCWADNKLQQPGAKLSWAKKLTGNKSLPRLMGDRAGGLWLVLRHHASALLQGEVWQSYALRYDGQRWSAPRPVPGSRGLLDHRPAVAPWGDGLLAVASSDGRLPRDQNDLLASVIRDDGPVVQPALVKAEPTPPPTVLVIHENEKEDVARMRSQKLEAGGKTLRYLRGEFHRHTDYTAHRDGDGLLEDSWRYALDAGALDWMGNGDHDNGYGVEYSWWQIQKMTDLVNHPPHFVAVHSYERSNPYPNGHRNVILPQRGIRPLPRGDLKGTLEKGTPDTRLLYAYLKHFGGICSPHTTATGMGTDWRDHDPEVEPVVEIFQGCRQPFQNYEHRGAPLAAQKPGKFDAGFVWEALSKGYRLGFQSSSDHFSTHISCGVVLAEDSSRRGIIEAFKHRRCYAANDNILLDVRCAGHLMGQAFATAQKPTLEIAVHGPLAIAKLHVVRDNQYVHSLEPKERQVRLRYTDEAARPGQTSYYYVRVEQTDGNLAWSSPMWITYRP